MSKIQANRNSENNNKRVATKIYYDTKKEKVVAIRKRDGWSNFCMDSDTKTWSVQEPRDYIADAGCETEIIPDSVKVDRIETGRYTTLPKETVDAIIERAVEKNKEWLKVNRPHIPFDGDGGVNIYVNGERLRHRSVESPTEVIVKDSWPEPTLEVYMKYRGKNKSIIVTTNGEEIQYSKANDPDSIHEGVTYEADDKDNAPTVELRVDTECEEPEETEYSIPTEKINKSE